jgi:hypothetical protein
MRVEVCGQRAAIESLPAAPGKPSSPKAKPDVVRATGIDNAREANPVVPRGAETGANQLAFRSLQTSSICIEQADANAKEEENPVAVTPQRGRPLHTSLQRTALAKSAT